MCVRVRVCVHTYIPKQLYMYFCVCVCVRVRVCIDPYVCVYGGKGGGENVYI